MKINTQKVNKAQTISLYVFVIAIVMFGVHILFPLIWKFDTTDLFFQLCTRIYLTVILLSIASSLILSLITTDDDALREKVASPLKNLNSRQEKRVIALLKSAGKPVDDSDKMNRAEVAKVLLVLKAKNCLDDSGDFNKVRLWVEKVTGLRDSDRVHFTEQYKRAKSDDTYEKKIDEILHMID